MKLSHVISVVDEVDDIKELIPYVSSHLMQEDNLLVVVDTARVTTQVVHALAELKQLYMFTIFEYPLDFKNINGQFQAVKQQCDGEFMHIICADERPPEYVLHNALRVLLANQWADALALPRINIYPDLTPETSESMYIGNRPKNYLLTCPRTEQGWICWPDYQVRVFKRTPELRHGPRTHDGIMGFNHPLFLPADATYAIRHVKTVEHQSKINRLYDTVDMSGT